MAKNYNELLELVMESVFFKKDPLKDTLKLLKHINDECPHKDETDIDILRGFINKYYTELSQTIQRLKKEGNDLKTSGTKNRSHVVQIMDCIHELYDIKLCIGNYPSDGLPTDVNYKVCKLLNDMHDLQYIFEFELKISPYSSKGYPYTRDRDERLENHDMEIWKKLKKQYEDRMNRHR